jgi:hypothetical protein
MPKLLRFALGERNQLSNHVERHQLSKHAYRWAVEVPGEVPRQSARLLSPLPTVAAMPSIPAGKPVTVPSTARSESQAAYLPIRPSRWRSRVASSFSPPRGPLSRERPVRRGRPAPYLSRDGTLVHLAPFATPHMGLFEATAWGYLGWPPYDSAALTSGLRTAAGSSPRGTSIQDVPAARSTATTGAWVTLPRSPRDPSKSAQGAR